MKNYDLKIQAKDESEAFYRAQVIGCLDSHTVVAFEKSLSELLESGANRILIDLSRLNYISSAGISALMGLTHRLRKDGGDLVILKPTEKVFRVFRTLGFTNIFTIAENENDLQQSFTT